MLLLALDTSSRQASVALCDEYTLYGEYTWQIGNNHSVELLDRVRLLVAERGESMQVIDAVAVATGPGSFNGVRVAVAAAKAFAFALQKPLVGVSTLEIIAAQQRQWRGLVCSILEAGRSDLYAACYIFDELNNNGEITYHARQLSDYLILPPQRLISYLKDHVNLWVGEPGERQLPPFLFWIRHASLLAQLALQRLYEGRVDDPMLLEPLYLRRPSITTSTRKQPLLGQKLHRSTDASQTEREEGALRH